MEPDRAIEIVQALADGVDPCSGERFPAGSPYAHEVAYDSDNGRTSVTYDRGDTNQVYEYGIGGQTPETPYQETMDLSGQLLSIKLTP